MKNEKEIVIDGNEIFDFTKVILEYKDANDIEFRNYEFTKEDINELKEIKQYDRIGFNNCIFEDEKLIKNIKCNSLSLIDNRIINYEFVNDMLCLERLTIIGGEIDCNKLNNLQNLEYLRLSNDYIKNIELLKLEKLKYLFIDNTNIKDLSFIRKFPYLELLSISDNQKENNEELFNEINNRVEIIIDSIIETDVFLDE